MVRDLRYTSDILRLSEPSAGRNGNIPLLKGLKIISLSS